MYSTLSLKQKNTLVEKCILFIIACLSFIIVSSDFAEAKKKSESLENKKQDYSDSINDRVLEKLGWTIHPQPLGQVIKKIHIVTLPVFLEGEYLDTWTLPLNYLHTTTKKTVISKESRLRSGQQWSKADALETERNLRTLAIFTSVRVLPVKKVSSAVDQVKNDDLHVIIITRDLWSLRLESSFSYNAGVLNYLSLSLSERNLLGRRILLSTISSVNPFSVVGGLIINHRRFGPDLSLTASVSGTWTRATGQREGESAQLSLARPLFNLDQKWSLGLSLGSGRQRSRLASGEVIFTDDDPTTAEVEETPIEWELKTWSISFGASRQWSGKKQKKLSLGLGVSKSERSLFDGVSASQEQRFRNLYLPPDRFQVGPSMSFAWYDRSYTAYSNVSTYGLREDLRLGMSMNTGHSISLVGDRAYTPNLSVGYTLPIYHSGFISTSLGGGARVEDFSEDNVFNRSLRFGLSVAIPLYLYDHWSGYLIFRSVLSERWNDNNKAVVSLGGDAGLRGYPNAAFTVVGGGLSRNHVEYRTRPWRWSFIHLGGVLFYEGGSVHEQLDRYRWKHSTGLGMRLLFPQVNRSVFRIDLSRPLSPYPNGQQAPPVVLSIGSAQAFAFMPWE